MTDMLLPEGWVEVSLGDICFRSQYGYTTKATNEGYVKYLRTTDITKKDLNWSSVPYCETIPEDILKYQLYHNDIVISRAGSIGFSCLLSYPPNNAIFASYLIRFRPLVSICAQYLKWYLETPFYWQQLYVKSVGNALQNVNASKLSDIIVFLPPIAEQEEIAQRVDRAIGHVDELKSRLETLLTTLKTFRQSVLNAAVTGKLTENWREETTLDSWAQSILSNYIYKPTYGSSQKSQKSGKIPVIRMGNIQNGVIDWDNLVYTSDDEEIKKYSLEFGDVLFNRTNSPELVGKTAIYKGEQKAIYAGYLIKIKCLSNLLPDYLNYSLNSSYAKDYCQKVKSDGVNQSNINAQKLKNYTLLIPPLAEQEEIVKRVEAYFALADQIEKQVQSALDKVNLLTQSILAKAFRGELTKEWRKKNPELISGENSAEALLKRIKAEKDALEKLSKKNKEYKSTNRIF